MLRHCCRRRLAERIRIAHSPLAYGFGWLELALLTTFAILVQGYHPGLEDDGFYLAAIQHNLNLDQFPHDVGFSGNSR